METTGVRYGIESSKMWVCNILDRGIGNSLMSILQAYRQWCSSEYVPVGAKKKKVFDNNSHNHELMVVDGAMVACLL